MIKNNSIPQRYVCDPWKAVDCPKTNCGICEATTNIDNAKLDALGRPMRYTDTSKPTTEQLISALKACATEEPQPEYPCKQCYLHPLSRDGRMSTGRSCFEHLAFDVIDVLKGGPHHANS